MAIGAASKAYYLTLNLDSFPHMLNKTAKQIRHKLKSYVFVSKSMDRLKNFMFARRDFFRHIACCKAILQVGQSLFEVYHL